MLLLIILILFDCCRPGFGNPSNLVPLGSGGPGERIRPERLNRRGLHSLTHFDYEELGGRPASQNTASAMTIAGTGMEHHDEHSTMHIISDLSPKLALQRLLMLYENGEHRSGSKDCHLASTDLLLVTHECHMLLIG